MSDSALPSDLETPPEILGSEEIVGSALPAERKRIWTCYAYPFIGILLAIAFQAILGIVLAFVLMADGGDVGNISERLVAQLMQPSLFILTLVLGQLGFAIATFVPGFLSKESFVQRYGLKSFPEPAKVYGYTLAGSIFVLALAFGLVYLVAMVIKPDGSVGTFFEAITPGWGILFVILVAVMPGVIEEALFRGYIQQRFMTRWSPLLSIGVASILFALAHITPHGIAIALPLGIWFGIISWRVGSIWPTIACHAFVNGGLNTWRLVCKFGEIDDSTALIFNVIFVLIGLVGFVLACRLLSSSKFDRPASDVGG